MKVQYRYFVLATLLCMFISMLLGCESNTTEVSDGSGSEAATTAISGSSGSSEGALVSNLEPPRKSSFLAQMVETLQPIRNSWAVPSCNWLNLNSGCSSNSETISFSSCSSLLDRAVSINGSETLQWTGLGCCTTNPLSASSSVPCSFTRRTLDATGSVDPLSLSVGSNSVTLNTEDSSGFNQSKTGGFSIVCQGSEGNSTCDGQREITIHGAHYTGKVASAQWDYTVSTDSPLVVQGHGSDRKVLSGTLSVQHNLANYVSVTTITSTLTHSSGCCFPTGGSVKTTFSGGSLDGKSETMTYGPGCGEATLNNSNQHQTGLTLHHCL